MFALLLPFYDLEEMVASHFRVVPELQWGRCFQSPHPADPGTSPEPRHVGRREEAVWCGNGQDTRSAFPEDSRLAFGSFIQDAADAAATSQPWALTGAVCTFILLTFS